MSSPFQFEPPTTEANGVQLKLNISEIDVNFEEHIKTETQQKKLMQKELFAEIHDCKVNVVLKSARELQPDPFLLEQEKPEQFACQCCGHSKCKWCDEADEV